MIEFHLSIQSEPVITVKTMIGIQTTTREVTRGCEAAVQSSPAEVTVLFSASSSLRLLEAIMLLRFSN